MGWDAILDAKDVYKGCERLRLTRNSGMGKEWIQVELPFPLYLLLEIVSFVPPRSNKIGGGQMGTD